MEKQINEESFLRAYEDYADAVFRHCYFRTFNRERARDIMQDTFAKTWEYLSQGKSVENLRAFLYKVANNIIIDQSRRKQVSSLDDLMEQGFDVPVREHERTIAGIHGRQVLKIVELLDEKYRDVIIMRFVDDLSPQEISQIIGETENVVSVRIHRGIRQVRALLAKAEAETKPNR